MIYYINALKTDDNTAGPKAPNDIYINKRIRW